MPTTVAVGEKLPAIQNAAKTIGNGITLLIGAGLITLAVLLAPDEWDELIIAVGAGLTGLAELLVTWGTRNAATVPLVVDPAPPASAV
jgi:protein-S-isoprenylcysteine O-methyltransferase Ste14